VEATEIVHRCRQGHFVSDECDQMTRRANQQNLSSPRAKNIPLNPSGKSALSARPVPPEMRGVSRSSRTCGGMRWTRGARLTSARIADGEVVLSWRPNAGAKFAGSVPRMTVATKPGHRGEREVSRNTIAQGRPECFR